MQRRNMVAVRLLSVLVVTATAVGPAAAHPEASFLSLERWLLPAAIADRIAGSGVERRSFVAAGGAAHLADVAMLRVSVGRDLAVRAGFGLAAVRPRPLDVLQSGVASSGTVSAAVWRRAGFRVEIDASAARLRYREGTTVECHVFVALRRTR